ncbi:MAG: hypothetical protein SangKO_001700 [Sandaracinaceae bacterium]
MAMGRRRPKQKSLFVEETERMPAGPRHRFYDALNGLLGDAGFDEHVEALCALAYEARRKGGRPSSIPPRRVLPDAADRILRGDRVGAGDLLALRGLALAQAVPRVRGARANA